MPIGMIASLIICTMLYVLMSGVLTGMKKYTIYLGDSAAVATAFAGKPWAQALVSAGALAGMTSVLARLPTRPAAHFHGDGARWIASAIFCPDPSALSHAYITTIWTGIVVGGVAMLTDIGSLADLTNIGTLFAFCSGLLRRHRAARNGSEPAAAVSRAVRSGVSDPRRASLRRSDVQPADRDLAPVSSSGSAIGLLIYFLLQRAPQPAPPRHRYRRNRKRIPADRAVGHRMVVAAVVTAAGVKQRIDSVPRPR